MQQSDLEMGQAIWEADQEDNLGSIEGLEVFRSRPGYDWVVRLLAVIFYFHTDEDASFEIFRTGGR